MKKGSVQKLFGLCRELGVLQLDLGFLCPHFMGVSNVSVCVGECVGIGVCFPFIGVCGVCG